MRKTPLLVLVALALLSCNGEKYAYVGRSNSDNSGLIYRGPIPDIILMKEFGVQAFIFESLKGTLNRKKVLDKKKKFVIYSLIKNDPNLSKLEHEQLHAEIKYFKKNPTKGKLVNYPLLSEDKIPPSEELDEHIDKIYNYSKEGHNVFFHCHEGCDRTGAIADGLYMKYFGLTYDQAIEKSKKICGRDQSTLSMVVTKNYCHYLKKKGYNVGNCPN